MLNGLYSAAAGMYAQQTWIDTLASDIARFKREGSAGSRSRASSSIRRVMVNSGTHTCASSEEWASTRSASRLRA